MFVIKEADVTKLERELARAKRILTGNKNLMPQSKVFYERRREMIEAELAARAAPARS